jgi:hypothetical protein
MIAAVGDQETARRMTPVLRFTRAVYVLGFCLTASTGIGLFAVPGRTADYWAWTIKAPLTAAFFGAGYVGAATSLALAARTREWQRARIVAVAALTLTSLALVATLRNLDPFAFGSGGLREAIAWIWLAVYVALPPLALAAFVLQERAGGSREYGDEPAALPAIRLAFGIAGAALVALVIGLLAEWSRLAANWPWPLPPLPAAVVGAWLCAYAVPFLWFALRERAWSRARIAVVPAVISFGLSLVAAARLSDGFRGRAETGAYIACLAGLIALVGAAAYDEERRHRAEGTAAPAAPAIP